MDARRKVSIDAFIFSPRSQTSDQILQKNIPKLGPKGDFVVATGEDSPVATREYSPVTTRLHVGKFFGKIKFLVAPLAKVPIGK